MGIDVSGLRFLLRSHASGVRFGRVLTLGRQGLNVSNRAVASIFAEFGVTELSGRVSTSSGDGYADSIFKALGATEVTALDVSRYEAATLIHDMNYPVPDALHESFDMIFDGGTLEHVFNFPVALQSCMAMLSIGGHFLTVTPANNFMGHGFYQFSPELFFRVFSDANSFAVQDLVVIELTRRIHWYRAKDPKEIRERVTLRNSRATYIGVCARKLGKYDAFTKYPQQSDYEHIYWSGVEMQNAGGVALHGRVLQMLNDRCPDGLKDLINRCVYLASPKFPRRMYEKLKSCAPSSGGGQRG